MILNSIIIDNIRSYTHEEVVFPRGISLFEGDIGSGKSTVLMSIEFALFGLGSQKAESLLSKKSESGYVVLEFSVDGEKYEIKRTLKRKNSRVNQDPKNSWIKIKDEILPLSTSELKQQVLKILKFNEPDDPKAGSKIFRYAIFTPQEAMKEVLSDSGKRLDTIRKAFGIEEYSDAKLNSQVVVSELDRKSAVLQERFGNITQLKSEIFESKESIVKVNKIIATMSKNIEDEKLKENKIIEQIKSFQGKNNERIKLEVKKENLEDKIESSKKQFVQIEQEFEDHTSELKQNNDQMEKLVYIKRPETELSISDITNEIRKVQKINNELIENNSKKNSITQDLSKLKETLGDKINSDKQSLDDSLSGLQKEKGSLEKFLDEIIENNDKMNTQQVEKNTIISSLEKEIAEFVKLGSNCPTCKQEITENHHHTLVDKKQFQVKKLKKELEKIADSFFESKNKSKEIKEKLETYTLEISEIGETLPAIEEYHTKSSKLNDIETKIKEIHSSQDKDYGDNPVEFLSNLKDELTEFENATKQMKQILESRKKIEEKVTQRKVEFENIEKEITQNESELSQTESRLESFDNIGEKISELEITQNIHRDKINELSGTLASSKEKKNNESEKIQANEEKISESKKWQEKFKRISDIKKWFEEFFIPTISQIEKQVLQSISQNFNETYTRWYSILVEDPTKESRIDENFTPIINQDGYDQEIGYLSGGEKTSIALAYRLTLNSLMRKETESMKSNLLILDEPTDGFSKNQLGKIRELLDELKSEQIILVSHEKELETYVDNIFQVSKENGISKISRVN
jgi:DNA repair protein SbcC/Rad50